MPPRKRKSASSKAKLPTESPKPTSKESGDKANRQTDKNRRSLFEWWIVTKSTIELLIQKATLLVALAMILYCASQFAGKKTEVYSNVAVGWWYLFAGIAAVILDLQGLSFWQQKQIIKKQKETEELQKEIWKEIQSKRRT